MGFKATQKVVPITTASSMMAQDTTSAVGQVGESIVIKVPAGAATVYLGGSDVTAAANNFPLAAGEEIAIDAAPGEVLYGVCETTPTTVSILYQGI